MGGVKSVTSADNDSCDFRVNRKTVGIQSKPAPRASNTRGNLYNGVSIAELMPELGWQWCPLSQSYIKPPQFNFLCNRLDVLYRYNLKA